MKDAKPGSCVAFTENDCKTVMSCAQVSSTGSCSIVSTGGGGGCACHVPADNNHGISSNVSSSSSTATSSGVSDSCGLYAGQGTCNWHTYYPGEKDHYDVCNIVRPLS